MAIVSGAGGRCPSEPCGLMWLYWVPSKVAGPFAVVISFVVALAMAWLLAWLLGQNNLTAFVLLGRRPRTWSELLSGVTPLRAGLWVACAAACVLLIMHGGWKTNIILVALLMAAAMFVMWRRSRAGTAPTSVG